MRPARTPFPAAALAATLLAADAAAHPFLLHDPARRDRPDPPGEAHEPVAADLAFEPNLGQAPARFDFVARTAGGTLFVSAGELVLVPALAADGGARAPILVMRLVGASASARAVALERLPGTVTRLVGREPCGWVHGAPTYARVRIDEVWPGIDALHGGAGGALRYDFLVAPGADPAAIRLAFDGTEGAWIDDDGALVLETEWGALRQAAPVLWQAGEAGREPVAGGFELCGDGQVGFRIGGYDRARELVIDPTVTFHALIGGSSVETITDVQSDGEGGCWVLGWTASSDFPLSGMEVGPLASSDVFVLHVDAAGAVVQTILIGGSGSDTSVGLGLDVGTLYVSGNTSSADFPVTTEAFQLTHMGQGDAFVMKLDVLLGTPFYSTYVGGSGNDTLRGFDVDVSAEPVLVGETASRNFPNAGGLDAMLDGPTDAFLTRMNSSASDVVWSGLHGGANRDSANAVALDPASAAGVVGVLDDLESDSTAFLLPVAPDGTLGAEVFFGGHDQDAATGVDSPSEGYYAVCGTTSSADATLFEPLQAQLAGLSDAFYFEYEVGFGFAFSTYWGGSGIDGAVDVILTPAFETHLLLSTASTDLPLDQPVSLWATGNGDAYLVSIDPGQPDGTICATYLPAGDWEKPRALALDGPQALWIAGGVDNESEEHDQPADSTQGAVQGVNSSCAFLSRFALDTQAGFGTASFALTEDQAFYTVPYEFFVYRKDGNSEAASVPFVVYNDTHIYPELGGTVEFAAGSQVGRAVVTFPRPPDGPAGEATLILVYEVARGGLTIGEHPTRHLLLGTAPSGGGGGGHGGSEDPCLIESVLPGMDRRGGLEPLRRFRDRVLLRTPPGRALTEAYYDLSRSLVPWLERRPLAAELAGRGLVPVVLAFGHPLQALLVVALAAWGAARARRLAPVAWGRAAAAARGAAAFAR